MHTAQTHLNETEPKFELSNNVDAKNKYTPNFDVFKSLSVRIVSRKHRNKINLISFVFINLITNPAAASKCKSTSFSSFLHRLVFFFIFSKVPQKKQFS